MHNLFFLFPIVFGINLIHFFDEKKDGAAGNLIVFLVLRSPVTMVTPFDRGKTIAKSANFTKNANCFEECNVLAMESVSSAPFLRGETKVRIFGKEKCKTLRQFQHFGKEKCKLLRQFQRY